MELFKPNLTLVPQLDDVYDLLSVTLTPTACFQAGRATIGEPPGVVVTPETLAVTLEIRKVGQVCADVITPVRHFLRGLEVGGDSGKTHVTAYAVFCGAVVGVSTIYPFDGPQAKAAAGPCFPTSDWYAWVDKQPPGPPSLHVMGTVTVPSTCYEASLEPGAVVPPPPNQFPLILKVKKLEGPCLPVVTRIPVRFDQEDYKGNDETVGVYQGDCPPVVIDIEEVS